MRRIVFLLVSSATLVLSACGGGGYSVSGVAKSAAPAPPAQGNWYLAATSSTFATSGTTAITSYSGPMTVSGGTASISSIGNGSCFPPSPLVLSGPVSGQNISLTTPQSPSSGFILTITGKVTGGTNIDGTYQLAGSTDTSLCRADVGTIYGAAVAPFTGTWSGNVSENQYPSGGLNGLAPIGYVPNVAAMSVVTTQATTAVTFPNPGGGTISAYPLNGTVTWTNATCFGSGAIDPTQSYIFGNSVIVTVTKAQGAYPTYSFGTSLAQPNSPLATLPVFLQPAGGPCNQYAVSGSLPAS